MLQSSKLLKQRRFNAHMTRKRAEAEMKQVLRDFAKTAKLYTKKLAASIKLQVILRFTARSM